MKNVNKKTVCACHNRLQAGFSRTLAWNHFILRPFLELRIKDEVGGTALEAGTAALAFEIFAAVARVRVQLVARTCSTKLCFERF
jgi:hypothetical protein